MAERRDTNRIVQLLAEWLRREEAERADRRRTMRVVDPKRTEAA